MGRIMQNLSHSIWNFSSTL